MLLQISCTEPYEIETVDFESVLVVESTITNEVRPQVVKLSKTSQLLYQQVMAIIIVFIGIVSPVIIYLNSRLARPPIHLIF